eukprot:7079162-Ditylum_brightwellii.AAC.1
MNDGINESIKYHHVKRKVIKLELATLQRNCVATFCYSNDASRIDTNTYQSVKVVDNDGKVEQHTGQV